MTDGMGSSEWQNSPRSVPKSELELRRECCADWPKPCGYHEGYLDGFDLGMEIGKAAGAGHQRWVDSVPQSGKAPVVDLVSHLQRQMEWSVATFGPGHRTGGVLDHIRKGLAEIEQAPLDITEWVDVIILAMDGAWRSGATPQQVADAIVAKQLRNESRVWPDWRTMPDDQAIEHVRGSE